MLSPDVRALAGDASHEKKSGDALITSTLIFHLPPTQRPNSHNNSHIRLARHISIKRKPNSSSSAQADVCRDRNHRSLLPSAPTADLTTSTLPDEHPASYPLSSSILLEVA